MKKVSCIIAVGTWDGQRSLLKNRDRNYVPDVKMVRALEDGIEVLYLEDGRTGWCEGMNEHGLGIVNSALAVEADEAEGKKKKTKGKSGDGEIILLALGTRDIDQAVKRIRDYKDGLKGHTFVATPDKVVTLEQTPDHECKVTTLDAKKVHVRTNHGHHYEDAGYTKGEDLLSSEKRMDQTLRVLRETDSPDDLATDLMDHRKDDTEDPNNMVRDTSGMFTTTQMVLDLTAREVHLYLIPEKVTYHGVDNRLPTSHTPRIGLKVFRYSPDGESAKEIPEGTLKRASGPMVADRFLAGRVASRYLGRNRGR